MRVQNQRMAFVASNLQFTSGRLDYGPVEVGLIGVCVFGLLSGFPVAGLIG